MKILILIYSDPESQRTWAGLSDAQRTEDFGEYAELNAELAASGELIMAEALDQSYSSSVMVRQGKTITTDGPFDDADEQVAGFYLLECTSRERAIEIAARIPDAHYARVEVRPVLDLSGQAT
ncbi:YciI family protein [Arthrobacter sp. GCM10027362]|uniref:YciI family protein n=1 Tax=Arthrobacter sp. GCM10027362 TaxID=3273379 RepID=UPI00363791B9